MLFGFCWFLVQTCCLLGKRHRKLMRIPSYFVLVFELRVNIAFVNYPEYWSCISPHAKRMEIKILCWNQVHVKYGVWNNLSVVILQLHVNRLVQFASFCSFLPTLLIFFTGRLWIVLACCLPCLQEFVTYQRWSKLDALWSPIEFSSPGIQIGVWINWAGLN